MFKDDLNDDIGIFLELEEFADVAEIDGVELTCQVISHTADKSGRQNETYDGLHGDFITVYFETARYTAQRERLPKQGDWAMVNGRRYDVMSVRDEKGITKMICGAYRQGTLRTL